MNSKFLIFLCLFMIQGCDDDSSEKELQTTINLIKKNRSIWLASGIESYTFTYFSSMNDCPSANPFPPVEITVVNGSILSIYVLEFDQFQDVENTHYSTIRQMFENMLENVGDIKGTPSFYGSFGYPKSYNTDLSDAECDGNSVVVSSFI